MSALLRRLAPAAPARAAPPTPPLALTLAPTLPAREALAAVASLRAAVAPPAAPAAGGSWSRTVAHTCFWAAGGGSIESADRRRSRSKGVALPPSSSHRRGAVIVRLP